MSRRAVALIVVAALGIGYAIGNQPDRELRAEAEGLVEMTRSLARTCESVVVENIRLSRRPHAMRDALDG